MYSWGTYNFSVQTDMSSLMSRTDSPSSIVSKLLLFAMHHIWLSHKIALRFSIDNWAKFRQRKKWPPAVVALMFEAHKRQNLMGKNQASTSTRYIAVWPGPDSQKKRKYKMEPRSGQSTLPETTSNKIPGHGWFFLSVPSKQCQQIEFVNNKHMHALKQKSNHDLGRFWFCIDWMYCSCFSLWLSYSSIFCRCCIARKRRSTFSLLLQ